MTVTAERDPAKLPWKELGVDIALECTGIFTTREAAAKHLEAGAKRVLVSAPADGADLTVVYGVNHDKLQKGHTIVSNASCTTNCLAPVAKVLHKAVGIEQGYMTTIHSYTGDQPVLDTLHKDLYRARAAALSMIPTSTGAAKAVGPGAAGAQGQARRHRDPRADAQRLADRLQVRRPSGRPRSRRSTRRSSRRRPQQRPLKGILAVNDQPLVSIDFNHNPASSTFDLKQTQVIEGTFVRVLSWYDNEWGFSNRMSTRRSRWASSAEAPAGSRRGAAVCPHLTRPGPGRSVTRLTSRASGEPVMRHAAQGRPDESRLGQTLCPG